MKKFLALSAIVLMLSFSTFAKSSKSGSWDGWVADEKCAAKGAATNTECAKKCIAGGEKMVFVTDKDKKVIAISNPDALKGHEGHHVNVKGSVKDGALTVQSASMLPDQAAK